MNYRYTDDEYSSPGNITKDIKVTYAVCDYISQKEEANQCHITVGGDIVE